MMFIHEKILRLPAVIERTGLSRSTIYLKIQQGIFPKQIKLGMRTSGWIEHEIDHWINQQIAQAHATQSKAA